MAAPFMYYRGIYLRESKRCCYEIHNVFNQRYQLGSIYAIIALGYTMVYGIAKMLNFAHGDVIMIGCYVVFMTMSGMNMNPLLSVILAVVVCTVLGVIIEKWHISFA